MEQIQNTQPLSQVSLALTGETEGPDESPPLACCCADMDCDEDEGCCFFNDEVLFDVIGMLEDLMEGKRGFKT